MTETSTDQALRGHLATLRPAAAAEALPGVLEQASAEGLGHTAMLERLLAIEVAATEARRRTSLERFASLPAIRDRFRNSARRQRCCRGAGVAPVGLVLAHVNTMMYLGRLWSMLLSSVAGGACVEKKPVHGRALACRASCAGVHKPSLFSTVSGCRPGPDRAPRRESGEHRDRPPARHPGPDRVEVAEALLRGGPGRPGGALPDRPPAGFSPQSSSSPVRRSPVSCRPASACPSAGSTSPTSEPR